MASIHVRAVTINFYAGTVACLCQTTVAHPLGESVISDDIILIEAEALPAEDWTNEDLTNALALRLQKDPAEVAVYVPAASPLPPP